MERALTGFAPNSTPQEFVAETSLRIICVFFLASRAAAGQSLKTLNPYDYSETKIS
jgi:hypothetical protein